MCFFEHHDEADMLRRDSHGSDASTFAPKDGTAEHLLEEASTMSLPSDYDFADPSQTMVILDWDDTLFPTTDFIDRWQVACPHESTYVPKDPEQAKVLQRWQSALRLLLERSCAMSDRCVIITNSKRPWVTDCLHRFAPDLLDIFARVERAPKVVYAGECLKQTRTMRAQAMDLRPVMNRMNLEHVALEEHADECMMTKHAAMKREVKRFYSRYPGQSWKNVVSIGDMTFERDALQELALRRASQVTEKFRTKIVLEPSESTASALALRLRYTMALLPAYIGFDGDLNLELDTDKGDALASIADALKLPGLKELPLSRHAWNQGPAPSHFEAEMCTEDLDFFVHTQVVA